MEKDINFYDTSSLLLLDIENALKEQESFIVSSITIDELKHIKDNKNKTDELRTRAQQTLKILDENLDKIYIVLHTITNEQLLNKDQHDVIDNDLKILSDAIYANNELFTDEIVFYSNDISLRLEANFYFGHKQIRKITSKEKEIYEGCREVVLSEEEMAWLYSNITENVFDMNINEYLMIKNQQQEIVDIRVWTEKGLVPIKEATFHSYNLGTVKPYRDDPYQRMICDSFLRNKLTIVRGKAGSGKTLLSLGFLFSKLDEGEIDRIICFCNPIATLNSTKLGYYPGDKNTKLLDSQVGNTLSSKLGSKYAVEKLLGEESLILLPFSDIRGYDTQGKRAGVYIMESQNLDKNLIKLGLQRLSEDSICIIDGDDKTQVDKSVFEGDNNGMRRAIEVFKGKDFFGTVELKNVHRSKIAEIAENI